MRPSSTLQNVGFPNVGGCWMMDEDAMGSYLRIASMKSFAALAAFISSSILLVHYRRESHRAKKRKHERRRVARICILGAGIIGLSVAQKLTATLNSRFHNNNKNPEDTDTDTDTATNIEVQVTIIADKFLQDTTSGGAGGLWEPYAITHTDTSRVYNWAKDSYAHFEQMFDDETDKTNHWPNWEWPKPVVNENVNNNDSNVEPTATVVPKPTQAMQAGVQRVLSYELFTQTQVNNREHTQLPIWSSICRSFRLLQNTEEVAKCIPSLQRKAKDQCEEDKEGDTAAAAFPFSAAWEYTTFTADQRYYLPYLTRILKEGRQQGQEQDNSGNGIKVKFIERHVSSLSDFLHAHSSRSHRLHTQTIGGGGGGRRGRGRGRERKQEKEEYQKEEEVEEEEEEEEEDEGREIYDIVINCTGLGAAQLQGNIQSMYPIRGQVVRVPTPTDWLTSIPIPIPIPIPIQDIILKSISAPTFPIVPFSSPLPLCLNWSNTYIIPNVGCLVMGGTLGDNTDYNTNINKQDTDDILNKISEFFPQLVLNNTPLLADSEWAGLRPCNNTGVCLESHLFTDTTTTTTTTTTATTHDVNKNIYVDIETETETEIDTYKDIPQLLIHNYGHGGAGITLAAGCAVDVVDNFVMPFLKQWFIHSCDVKEVY